MSETKATAAVRKPTFWEAVRFWGKLGLVSFGGPTGQIAIMHAELVEKKRWISEDRFLHALNFCMVLPGPEATQLAIYVGWLLHRVWGGIAAGVLFVLPAAVILWALSYVYMSHGDVPVVAAAFYGLQPAVLAIVAAAVLRIGSRALKGWVPWVVAGLAFAGLFVLKAPFYLIIVLAAVVGAIGGRLFPRSLGLERESGQAGEGVLVLDSPVAPSWSRAVRVVAVCLVVWWGPILAVGCWQGWEGTLFREGVFFSQAALVTFGGAYAVLPYVAEQAVQHYGWLSTEQMMAGLGLAETTPGPLIMVLQFVGFVGAWQHPGALPPMVAATLGAAVATWATFVPSFLFVFLGAPYIERLRHVRELSAALSCITAAVVGVVLNLAVWFGWHVLVPDGGRIDVYAALMAVVLFIGMQRFRWGIIPVILGAAVCGVVYRLFY